MWSGLPASLEQTHADLPDLTAVKYSSDLGAALVGIGEVLTLSPDVGVVGSILSDVTFTKSSDLLKAIHEARAVKTEPELVLMRHANKVSSEVHEEVVRAVGTRGVTSEGEAEAVWVAGTRKRGAKVQAYESIFAYGPNASTLHYIANSENFPTTKGGLLLVDSGIEIATYASDITRTCVVGNGGKFEGDAKALYEVVLGMQDEALAMIKPGASWEAIQLHMHLVAARGLLKLGVFKSGTAEELVEKNETVPFFPHGIGHFLGIDTHDVGGLPEGRSTDPRIRYLRLRKSLEVGHVVTVEPGLYFNEFLLAPTKNSQYVDQAVVEKFKKIGGVRIEDNVVVTENGFENLTVAAKTVADVEKVAGGK